MRTEQHNKNCIMLVDYLKGYSGKLSHRLQSKDSLLHVAAKSGLFDLEITDAGMVRVKGRNGVVWPSEVVREIFGMGAYDLAFCPAWKHNRISTIVTLEQVVKTK